MSAYLRYLFSFEYRLKLYSSFAYHLLFDFYLTFLSCWSFIICFFAALCCVAVLVRLHIFLCCLCNWYVVSERVYVGTVVCALSHFLQFAPKGPLSQASKGAKIFDLLEELPRLHRMTHSIRIQIKWFLWTRVIKTLKKNKKWMAPTRDLSQL